MWLQDLETLLTAAGITTTGRSTKAQIPTGDGPYLLIIATGGASPDDTQNSLGSAAAYEHPSAQIEVHAVSWTAGYNMAKAAWNAIGKVRNTTINGCWYQSIYALQEPFDGGLDDTKRITVKFNVYGTKRPS